MEEKRNVADLRHARDWYDAHFREHGTWPTSPEYAGTILRLSGLDRASGNGRRVLLDVACGGGHFLANLPPGVFARVGLDLSVVAAGEARRRAACPILVAAAEAIPLPDESVDTLVCLGSFEHFVDKDAACREFLRVTRAGATLVVLVPCDRRWLENDPQPIELVGTPDEWRTFFSERGFTVAPPVATEDIAELAAASSCCTVLCMTKPGSVPDAFFSGPFEPEEVRRLLALIDDRLALRTSLNLPRPPRLPGDAGTATPSSAILDPATVAAGQGLDELAAPLFNLRKARRLSRLGKALLNVPLRLFGRPQLYFNAEVRRILSSWSEVLRATLELQGELQHEVAAQRQLTARLVERRQLLERVLDGLSESGAVAKRLGAADARIRELQAQLGSSDVPQLAGQVAGLERWLTGFDTRVTGDEAWLKTLGEEVPKLWRSLDRIRLETLAAVRFGTVQDGGGSGPTPGGFPEPHVVDPEGYRRLCEQMADGLLVNVGCGDVLVSGYVNVDARPLPGVDVVADVRHLPFPAGSVAELYSSHLIEHFHRYELTHRILPYWRTLLRPAGKLRIVCPNWQAALEAHRGGALPLERLHEITFGSQEYDGNDHLAMYTPETLPALLEAAGFVGCAVTVENRDNHGCPEMEVVAVRPSA